MKKKYNKGLYKATRFTGKVVRNKTKKKSKSRNETNN